jgi:beta-galactosidase
MSKMVIDEVKIFNKVVSLAEMEESDIGAVLHLNFEEDKKEDDFYAVGLGGRTYGIVWPNRELQPEIHQIKKSGQPVKFEVLDIDKGILKITNRHHFKNLNELGGVWQILVDGESTQRGFFNCDISAQETGEITIDYRRPRIDSKSECLLLVSFVLKEDLNWAGKGHEIAWEQFEVPSDYYFVDDAANNKRVKVTDNEKQLTISGNNFRYIFDKNTGQFISLKFNESEYLEGGPVFNVWRAPIANDIDPWGNYMFSKENRTVGYGRSIDNQLRTLGMRDLQVQVDDIDVLQLSDEKLTIRIKAFSNSSNPVKQNTQGYFSAFERNEKWTISANGTIELEQEIIPHGLMPDMLQKIGLQFQLPKAFSTVQWYGRGPFENYPDRKTGAKVGLYQSTSDDMFEPYIIPQEYGNRSDVRWLKIQNEAGRGLLIKGDELLNFSLHKYTTDNLSRAMYTYQLEEAPNTILNVDYEVSGVGGTAIRQLQKYRVRPHVGKYKLTIQPF